MSNISEAEHETHKKISTITNRLVDSLLDNNFSINGILHVIFVTAGITILKAEGEQTLKECMDVILESIQDSEQPNISSHRVYEEGLFEAFDKEHMKMIESFKKADINGWLALSNVFCNMGANIYEILGPECLNDSYSEIMGYEEESNIQQ